MAADARPGPHGSSRLRTALDYRRYPTFSWDWSWRRSVLLGAILSLYGVINGTTNGLMLDDWHIGVGTGAVTAFIMAVIVSIGPLAASWVRSRRWTSRWEKSGIVAAVLLGVAAGHGGNWIGNEYAQRVILRRAMQETTVNPAYLARLDAVNSSTIVWIADTILFFLASGGISLRTYLEEQRRAIEEAHERELGELQLQRRQADLQLLVLQAQIEPHFLFNTLASLRSLLRQDVGRAEAMLDALVAHLRAALPVIRDSRETSTLEEQLAVCSSYLELMTVRLPDRLSFAIDVPQGLRAAAFPPLVLLTLVENAIKHGIEPKPGPGRIRIEARREPRADGPHLIVSVADDGAGLSGGIGRGVGLSNIRAQLALKYGTRAALSLSGSLRGGAIATIDIPADDLRIAAATREAQLQ